MCKKTKQFSLQIALAIIFIFVNFLSFNGVCQDTANAKVTFSGGVDLMSRYVWRGLEFEDSPSIQPLLEADYKGFKLGAWGAYKFTGQGFQETDLYITKSWKYFTLAVWDYYSFSDTKAGDFFNYEKESTSHMLESQVILNGGEAFPMKLLASWFFYGAAPSKSFYLELSYPFQLGERSSLEAFCGFTPRSGYYADKAAFVNLSLKFTKAVKITDSFDLPVQVSLINNPNTHDLFIVAGISL
jgi:hypothetical protein